MGVTLLGPNVLPGQGVLIEATATALLIVIIKNVTDPRRTDHQGSPPIAIGLYICGAIMATVNTYIIIEILIMNFD